MNRIIIAIATTAFALIPMMTPAAHAGSKTRLGIGLAIGAIGAMHAINKAKRYERKRINKKRHKVRRHKAKRKVYTAKKKKPVVKAPVVAKVAVPVPTLPVKKDAVDLVSIEQPVVSENSSISTAALPPIEETASIDKTVNASAEPVQAAADTAETAEKLDCKKFFPSVGMTLSVPCE